MNDNSDDEGSTKAMAHKRILIKSGQVLKSFEFGSLYEAKITISTVYIGITRNLSMASSDTRMHNSRSPIFHI